MESPKLKILKFQIFSVVFVWILGTLLHFTYEWSNNNLFVAVLLGEWLAYKIINSNFICDKKQRYNILQLMYASIVSLL